MCQCIRSSWIILLFEGYKIINMKTRHTIPTQKSHKRLTIHSGSKAPIDRFCRKPRKQYTISKMVDIDQAMNLHV